MTLISNTLYLWSLSPSLPSSPTHRLCFVCTTPLKSCCLSRSFSPTESAPVTCKGSCCSIHKYIVNHPHFPTVPKAFRDPPPPLLVSGAYSLPDHHHLHHHHGNSSHFLQPGLSATATATPKKIYPRTYPKQSSHRASALCSFFSQPATVVFSSLFLPPVAALSVP